MYKNIVCIYTIVKIVPGVIKPSSSFTIAYDESFSINVQKVGYHDVKSKGSSEIPCQYHVQITHLIQNNRVLLHSH